MAGTRNDRNGRKRNTCDSKAGLREGGNLADYVVSTLPNGADSDCEGRAARDSGAGLRTRAVRQRGLGGRRTDGGAEVTLDDFVGRLSGVKRLRRGVLARCPAHDDKNPSLSVCEKDGRILAYCHAGCKIEAILAAMELEFRHLFIEEREPVAGAKKRIAREYIYRDEMWREGYRIFRYADKSFKVGRFEDGEWRDGLGDATPLLYMLPEVKAQPDKTVYVVEGEKDAEKLRDLGFVATCNPFGAGKFLPEYAEVLRGRNVVIIQDKDKPGWKHGAEVFEMMQGVAASVRLVEAKEGKDATDHFDAGWGIDDFVEVSPTKGASREKGYQLQRVGDLLAEPPEEHAWLVENLFVMGGTSLTGAKPKVGKSTLLRSLAFCICRGLPFLGRTTVKGPVIYLAIEEKKAEVVQRFREMGCTDEDEIYIHTGSTPIEALESLRPEIEQLKPVLVIVDPLFKWVKVPDASDYAKVSGALEPVIDLSRETGAHFALSHHLGKGDREDGDSVLGSTAIFGAVDTLLVLRKSSEQRTARSTNRYGEDLEECVLILDKESSSLTLGGSLESCRIGAAMGSIEELLRAVPELSDEEIRDRIGGNKALTGKALRSGYDDGRFIRTGEGRRGKPYLYSLADIPFSRFPTMEKQENEKTGIVDKEV